MSRPVGSKSTDMRYRPDTGFERRCESCTRLGGQRFWPITLEFWDPSHSLRHCRACERMAHNRRASSKYRGSSAERARRADATRKWRSDVGIATRRLKDRERYWARKARHETAA